MSRPIYTDGTKKDCFKLAEIYHAKLSNGKGIRIPAGFETDFASVPRLFWVVYPPHWKPYRDASLIHDFLYMTPGIVTSRAFADAEFRRQLINNGTWKITAWIFWACVRAFGSSNWKKYKYDNANAGRNK